MKNTKFTWAALAAGSLAALGSVTTASAQSSDTLIDVLVDKGVLTLDEAKQLRAEADKDFTRAYAAKSGMPEWVTALKFSGDFRGRYDGIYVDNPAQIDRPRWRYRLRFGFTALMLDNLEVGLRLASGNDDPISRNTTLSDNGAPKPIGIDLAYGKYYLLNRPTVGGSVTFGKMKNPFHFSSMVFDHDYTPEGGAMQYQFNLNQDPVKAQVLKLNLGAFVLDELKASSSDPYLLGAQLRWEGKFGEELKPTGWNVSAGVAFLTIQNANQLTRSAVPNVDTGNTRIPTTKQVVSLDPSVGVTTNSLTSYETLANKFNPIVADASVGYTLEDFWMYNAPFPIVVGGEYMYNPAAGTRNTGWNVGVTFGKAGKSRRWELSYNYKYLESDAWYEQFVDSDFGAYYAGTSLNGTKGYGAGTNVRGHVISLAYSPFNSLTLAATAFVTELIDKPAVSHNNSDTLRVQVDAQWKF